VFIGGDPSPHQRKRTDDFVVVKSQSRTKMYRALRRSAGQRTARSSSALVTLGHHPWTITQSPVPQATSGFFRAHTTSWTGS
jgi:hypothetical protein